MGKQKLNNVQANVVAEQIFQIAKDNAHFLNVATSEGKFTKNHVQRLVALAITKDPKIDAFKLGNREVGKITNLVNEILSQTDLKGVPAIAVTAKKEEGKPLAKKVKEEKAEPARRMPASIDADGPIKAQFMPEKGVVRVTNLDANNLDAFCDDGQEATMDVLEDEGGQPTGDYDISCPVPDAPGAPATKKTKK